MSLKDVELKKTYFSDFDDILNEFYIPVLSKSIEYNRMAGFFSSTSLAVAARGIVGLIKNNGKMNLIVSPRLSKQDIDIIMKSKEGPESYIEKIMLDNLDELENEFVKDHVSALGWMIANNRLDIKIAILYDNFGNILDYEEIEEKGLFHPKVGIFKDSEGNMVSFSGSVNESEFGWKENIEEFKVFKNWEESELEYLNGDIEKFERIWNNKASRIKVMDVPKAVQNKLVKIAPKHIVVKYPPKKERKVNLYNHQLDAIDEWLNNGMAGMLEMATGTGKTYTALGALEVAINRFDKMVAIISCPYQHLIQQWKKEIIKFGTPYDKLIIADSSNSGWKNTLADLLSDFILGYNKRIIILTTHRTLSSNDFVEIMTSNNIEHIFIIGDEVHGLGAEKSRQGLLNIYKLRLGLSATPKRFFDSEGTDIIYNYFGKVVYEFNLGKAINTINPATGYTYLTPYYYIPLPVSLTIDEIEEFIEKTRSIIFNLNRAKEDKEKKELLKLLLIKRANIIKNAEEKYESLRKLLEELGQIKWTIVYTSPQQINRVMSIVNEKFLSVHRFTMEEGTSPKKEYGGVSEREYILSKFAGGDYQVLVAMKCLDEGVDIPPARKAILMASCENPREYIQRIGRVIRRYTSKSEAMIYDIIVVPSTSNLPKEIREIEMNIFRKELNRYEEIAKYALNSSDAIESIEKIKNKLRGV